MYPLKAEPPVIVGPKRTNWELSGQHNGSGRNPGRREQPRGPAAQTTSTGDLSATDLSPAFLSPSPPSAFSPLARFYISLFI